MGKKPDKGRDKAGTDSKADDDPWKTPGKDFMQFVFH